MNKYIKPISDKSYLRKKNKSLEKNNIEKILFTFFKSKTKYCLINDLLILYDIDFFNQESCSIKNFVKFYVDQKEELLEIKKIIFELKYSIIDLNLFYFESISDITFEFKSLDIENIISIKNVFYLNRKKPMEHGSVRNNIIFSDCYIDYIYLISLTISKNIKFINILNREDFSIESSIFNENLIISNSIINTLSIYNSMFKKSLYITKATIDKYVNFEETSIFEYCNFSFSIFKNGLNLSTLEINYNNFNLHKIEVNGNKTNRETYRIIKQSFLVIGNRIEANEFYAKEMSLREIELNILEDHLRNNLYFIIKNYFNFIIIIISKYKKNEIFEKILCKSRLQIQYKENIDKEEQIKNNIEIKYIQIDNSLFSNYIILKIYKYTSNFAQNPILTIYWILNLEFLLSGIYVSNIYNKNISFELPYLLFINLFIFIKKDYYSNLEKYVIPLLLSFLFYLSVSNSNFEHFFKFINILSTEIKYSGFLNNSLFFINKIVLGYLMYQFLISVRKDTKEL